MAASKSYVGVLAVAVTRCVADQPFVPLCIAEQCYPEAVALGGDAYSKSLASCVAEDFGPCAQDAWNCLGDSSCRDVLTCAPAVLDDCKDDIWKMVTDPEEREKLECLAKCMDDGEINRVCVVAKCPKSAVECIADSACRHTVFCMPKIKLACSKAAFECVFSRDGVCRDNLKCLGHGLAHCGGAAVNMLTDSKIADFVACAGTKCPHPAEGFALAVSDVGVNVTVASEPRGTAAQLLCMARKCSAKALKIFADQDMKDLVGCAMKGDLPTLCTSVWDCLGDETCANDLTCIVKPLESCGPDMWKLLTTPVERKRLDDAAACLRKCEHDYQGDFVSATFCVLDSCGQQALDCYRDDTCRGAFKCLPDTVSHCAVPSLDAYVHERLFQNSAKCIGRTLESCGRAAVEMLRDQNIAEAVRCASQCTRTPGESSSVLVV